MLIFFYYKITSPISIPLAQSSRIFVVFGTYTTWFSICFKNVHMIYFSTKVEVNIVLNHFHLKFCKDQELYTVLCLHPLTCDEACARFLHVEVVWICA